MKRELTILSAAALVLAACGGDDEAVEIDNAWARTSPMATTLGAAYFDITAADDDVLVAASVSSDVAGSAEIHEIVEAEMDMDDMDHDDMDDMDDDEMSDMDDMDDMGDDDMDDMEDGDHEMDMGDGDMAMVMQEMADGLPLPADETVSLEPGGYHVMLLDLVEPLETGDEFELTLDFENADDVTVTVTVAETAPGS
jgi:copper(I)-binding protein